MRKNYTYDAKEPQNRNELIDMVKNKEDVIILNHNIIEELDDELKQNDTKVKAKKTLKTAGIIGLLVLNLYNPLTWAFGIGSILAGGLLKDDFKQYNIYLGYDTCLRKILVFQLKDTVDLKYDKVVYPSWVGKIEYKKMKRNIKKRIK